MRLKLTHSKRPMQEIITTWDNFRRKYIGNLSSIEMCELHDELYRCSKTELHDESGTLYIEVVK